MEMEDPERPFIGNQDPDQAAGESPSAGPPLRRMRTSLVSRRRMEEMQQQETHQKYLGMQVGELVWTILYIIVLTLAYFLPAIFGGDRDVDCQMNTALANGMFGWVLFGLDAMTSVIWISVFAIKRSRDAPVAAMTEYVEKATIAQAVAKAFINPLGYAIFFYWNMVQWSSLTDECLTGYDLFDFLLWILLLLLCVAQAILVAIVVCLSICCAPCIIKGVKDYYAQLDSEQSERNGVIDAMVLRKFNPNDFKQMKECSICLLEFQEDEEVTPLPCNIAHYFHSACITEWLKTKNSCPLCRTVINQTDFEELNNRLQEGGGRHDQAQEL